jgi:hypothetical protein
LPQAAVAALAAPTVESNGEAHTDGELADSFTDENTFDAAATTAATSNKSSSPRPFPKMQLVKDLDLRPTDKQHLKALLDEKKPKGQNEKIALCVYWLRRVLEIDGVTPNHVYTCMDDVKIRIPNDLPQTLRNISNRNGWIDTTNSNAIEITTKGANLIQHDLPRNNGS